MSSQRHPRPRIDSVPTADRSEIRPKEVPSWVGTPQPMGREADLARARILEQARQTLNRAASGEAPIVPDHLSAILRLAILRQDVLLARGVLEQLEDAPSDAGHQRVR